MIPHLYLQSCPSPASYHLCGECGVINTIETGRQYDRLNTNRSSYYMDYSRPPRPYMGQLTVDEIAATAAKCNGEILPEDEENIIIRR